MLESVGKCGNILREAVGHLGRNARYRLGAGFLVLSIVLMTTCALPEASRRVEAVAPPPRAEIFPVMRCIRSIKAQVKWSIGLAFSPDGRMVATTADDKVVLWDVVTGAKIREKRIENRLHLDVAFLGTGGELACVTMDDIRILETPSLREKRTVCRLDGPNAIHFCCSADGKFILTRWGGETRRIDARSGTSVWKLNFLGVPGPNEIGAVSPSGKRVALAWDDEEYCVTVRDGGSGKELYRIPNREKRAPERIKGLAFTPDGRSLVACFHMQNRVKVWDAAEGKISRDMNWQPPSTPGPNESLPPSYRFGAYGLAISPDGKSCVVGCSDGVLRVFELVTGGLRGQQVDEPGRIAFAPNGRLLLTLGNSDGVLRFWDLRDTGKGSTRKVEPQEFQHLWHDLASEDARIGFSSILRLENSPAQAVDILRGLRRVPSIPPERLARLVEELDGDEFATREKATRELEGLGIVAEAALRKEAERPRSKESELRAKGILGKLPRFQKERIRHARGVEILEAIGTTDAKKILVHLAAGHAGMVETEDARAALARSMARSK